MHVCLSRAESVVVIDTGCAGFSGWARAGTLYVTTDVPLMTHFANVCTSVYVCPGRVGAVWNSGPDQN